VTGVWVAVVVIGAASMALKAAGPVLLGGRELPPRFQRLVALLAPTLLAALIATQIVGSGHRLSIDARAAGLAAGAVALRLRAPTLLVVVIGAATTALVRAAG
jgi:branched-subunit amino acid transport protein